MIILASMHHISSNVHVLTNRILTVILIQEIAINQDNHQTLMEVSVCNDLIYMMKALDVRQKHLSTPFQVCQAELSIPLGPTHTNEQKIYLKHAILKFGSNVSLKRIFSRSIPYIE